MYIEINDFFSCLKVVFSLFTEWIETEKLQGVCYVHRPMIGTVASWNLSVLILCKDHHLKPGIILASICHLYSWHWSGQYGPTDDPP